MICNCPWFLLKEELGALQPAVILLFGRTNLRDVIRPWAVPDDGYGAEQGPRLERDLAKIGDRRIDLFSLNHPSSRDRAVLASLKQLTASLARRPITSSDADR